MSQMQVIEPAELWIRTYVSLPEGFQCVIR